MLWVKAFHIVAMVSWFAGLFYLPRLFVYHASTSDQEGSERFKIMERKLYRGIMTPSAVATVILGLWLVSYNPDYYLSSGWFHAKMLLVVLLLGYHHACGRLLKKFALDNNTRSHIFYRWFNELPVLVLIGVAILVVVRPF
jgi:putative membrane protein